MVMIAILNFAEWAGANAEASAEVAHGRGTPHDPQEGQFWMKTTVQIGLDINTPTFRLLPLDVVRAARRQERPRSDYIEA